MTASIPESDNNSVLHTALDRTRRRIQFPQLPRLLRNTQIIIGLITVGLLVFLAITAPLIAPRSPDELMLENILAPPSLMTWFGTDELGRDIFSRVIYGGQVSIWVAALSVGISIVVGVPLGLIAGYFGYLPDTLIMRFMDALLAFPAVLLAIAIASALGPGITNAMIAIGIVGVPGFARIARAQALQVKQMEYVQAAKALGGSHVRIVTLHILPNSLAPLIVAATTSAASAILTEAALSFVGLGATPPTPSWGGMLESGYPLLRQAPWLSIFPGLAIATTSLGLNFLGDGLRDVLDPKLRGR